MTPAAIAADLEAAVSGGLDLLAHVDGYDQDAWVERQQYARVPFRDLVALWAVYNRHLVHVISATPAEALANPGQGPAGDVTLGFLMEDYVRHLRHHLDQLRGLLEPRP